jgi:lysine-N-methylase
MTMNFLAQQDDNDGLINKISTLTKWDSLFSEQFDYIFENYLVNFAFKNVFPFRGYHTLQEEFMMLAIHYTMIRFMAVCLAEVQGESFHEHDLIACIQTYSKEIEHNAVYLKYLYDTLMLNECNTIAKLSILVKG